MAIGDLCVNDAVTISQDDSIQHAAQVMEENNLGSLVVVADESTKPIGIVTDRDIALNVVAKNKNIDSTKVSEVMSQNLLTLECSQGIKEAIDAMRDKGVRRAPVMKDGKVCGVAAIDDLMTLIAKELNALSDLVQKQIAA
jgi:signal-transduction protein with cAMP-binding, CBS, and nucleotidyltransferase domain